MKWINVKDRLPKTTDEVLVKFPSFFGESMMVCNYEDNQWVDYKGALVDTNVYQISHWRNLDNL